MVQNIDPSADRDSSGYTGGGGGNGGPPHETNKGPWLTRRRLRRILAWSAIGAIISCAALLAYCVALFRQLEPMMAQTPRARPSVIYSDLYILRKGDIYQNTFLPERLNTLNIPFVSEPDVKVEWRAKSFDYPPALLPEDSPLRLKAGDKVALTLAEGRIGTLTINDEEREAIALEPAPVAQLSGASRSIRDYVKLEQIPTRLLQAFIAIEDQRFLEHPGFDPRGLARAMWVNLRSGSASQGASTITQQLIKNLLGTNKKTVIRKLRELVLAVLIEAKYSKDFILEKYLNEVYVGQVGALEVHGVAEAARYFYNKPLEKLSLSEMAVIAGIVRGPAFYSPYKHPERTLERRNTVLAKMAELRLITQADLQVALAEKIDFKPPSTAGNKAPYFADYVKSQVLSQLQDGLSAEDLSAEGLRIFTTLDLALQRRADEAVATTVRDLEARFKISDPLRLEGLLVAAEPSTGFVRALVGGRSYGETTFNRVLNMKRQAGSTFKPIAYLAAFRKGADKEGLPYTGTYVVNDEPWTYTWDGGLRKWMPRNYEKKYKGPVALREAFANSMNVPMARIAVDVGIRNVIEVAQALGITEPLPEVPSLSLGSVDVRPLELLQAYSTLANRGEKVELTTVRAITDENGRMLARFVPQTTRVFEPALIDLLNTFLRSVVVEGTAKILPTLGYSKVAYGKTGTTSFSRDAWFAGFSQGLVAVTWTGFDELKIPDEENAEEFDKFKAPAPLTGAGAALPTWARFFAAARPSALSEPEPELDSSLEAVRIDRTSGKRAKDNCPAEAVYTEYFLPDQAPEDECTLHDATN